MSKRPRSSSTPADRTRGTGTAPPVRCAIYTRKSSEEGLEQEFNSLDAQREAGEAYIASQRNEGWVPARCSTTQKCLAGRRGRSMTCSAHS